MLHASLQMLTDGQTDDRKTIPTPRILTQLRHKSTAEKHKALFRAPDPTQLNSTQLAVEMSWVELSCKSVQSESGALNTLTTQLNSTQLDSYKIAQFSEFWTFSELVELSWVELSRALWTRRKLIKTGCDPVCSYWPIAACVDFEFPA